MPDIALLFQMLQVVLKDRTQLALENVALRQQLAVYKRTVNELHMLRVLHEYVDYYNGSRAHSSLDGNAPEPRDMEAVGDVVSDPVLGGLHHRYSRSGLNGPGSEPD